MSDQAAIEIATDLFLDRWGFGDPPPAYAEARKRDLETLVWLLAVAPPKKIQKMGENEILGRAADAVDISANGLSKMTHVAHRLRNGWISNDEVQLNDVLCMMPGWEQVARQAAADAARREAAARDIIRALLAVARSAPMTESNVDATVKACHDGEAFLKGDA